MAGRQEGKRQDTKRERERDCKGKGKFHPNVRVCKRERETANQITIQTRGGGKRGGSQASSIRGREGRNRALRKEGGK